MNEKISSKRILVVEDNDDVRSVVTIYLKSKGYIVYEAVDGEEGIEKIISLKPDLLLTDILLPKIDGIDALKKIRSTKEGANIPVVMMSAVLKTRDIKNETANLNIFAFMQKPFKVRDLIEIINSAFLNETTEIIERTPERQSEQINSRNFRKKLTIRTSLTDANPFNETNTKTVEDHIIPIKGTLDKYSIPEILHYIYQNKRTGRLRIVSGSNEKRIYFLNGNPVYSESSIPGETLGAFLIQNNIINADQHKTILQTMSANKIHYGEAMLSLNLLEPNELFKYLELHLREKVTAAFSWFTGQYLFEAGESWKDDIIIARLKSGRIILDGVIQYWSNEKINTLNPFKNKTIKLSSSQHIYPDNEILLSADEVKILQSIKNGQTISQIYREFDKNSKVIQCIFAFYIMDLIEIVNTSNIDNSTNSKAPISIVPPADPETTSKLEQQILKDYIQLRSCDYFTILNVKQTDSPEKIKIEYDKLLNKYPVENLKQIKNELVLDKIGELNRKFTTAYKILSDPEKKKMYIDKLERPTSALSMSPRSKTSLHAPLDYKKLHSQFFDKGLMSLREADFEKALNFFLKADEAEHKPKYSAYIIWSKFLINPKDTLKNTESEFKILLKENSDETLIPYLLGSFYLRLKNKTEAQNYFKKALNIDPQNIDAARQLRILNMRQSTESSGLFDILTKKI
ncbi:MAG: response regulator [Deltaproteobacteria bacterium]|nr:response regulator [Deltaproteobacteria bacterium]